MKKNLSKQYNKLCEVFSKTHDDDNKYTNQIFFDVLRSSQLQGKNILDLGCGDGIDMEYYKYRFGGKVSGLDASEKMLRMASAKSLDVYKGYFDALPFKNNSFDAVVSKYSLQTIEKFDKSYREVARVLNPGGSFIFLTVHPIRQFFEKKTRKKDYFKKTIVKSILFGGKLTVEEPTHTIQEYLSPEFFKLFRLEGFIERADFQGAERINGNEYPTYMIISAKKR